MLFSRNCPRTTNSPYSTPGRPSSRSGRARTRTPPPRRPRDHRQRLRGWRQKQQVNSVFGEGVNPRLRKIRDGLDALGLPTDDLLNHGGPRLVYGVELTYNPRAYLLGMGKQPKYILPMKKPLDTTKRISRWWIVRWLLPRIDRDEILRRVARHSLIHPIRHGARVDWSHRDVEDMS